MCVTCGCSDGAKATLTRIDQGDSGHHHHASHPEAEHTHTMAAGTVVTHSHTEHAHHETTKPQPANNTLTLEQNILSKNSLIAAQNRGWLKSRQITALNLVSSPGAGKTTLLVKTIEDLKADIPITVIEGDQETAQDAERIAATGCPTIQVNTGTGCHLEAAMIERGLETLDPPNNSLVLIENVGNLVCPALFDLGEKAKVAMLSVTEGEDKPIKYPHMFRASQVMVLTKIDLLPYVNFDVDRCLDYARQVNPDLKIFQLSATSGEGLANWYGWLRAMCQR
ncbi:MAG: hydrogenase nickel incorporation protein HypB [Cyanobacteria bacterium P01_H01_bin.21]